MKKLIIFITFISFFGFSQNLEYSDPDLQGISKDRIERISELSKSYVNNNKVANVTTIINRNGKIVYGGGGIMPDIFVPLDTNSYHPAISEAIRKDLIRQFAFNYTNQHRSELESQELSNFIAFFELNINELKNLELYFNSFNVKISIFELSKIDKDILTTQIKAYIARNIWNDDGFFPVIHTIDNTFQKAIMQ